MGAGGGREYRRIAMAGVLAPILDRLGGGALVVVAAPAEARAMLRARGADAALGDLFWRRIAIGDRIDLVVSGVGKANAAGATARLLDLERDRVVVSAGLAGALPGGGASIGRCLVASTSVLADEGVETEAGFRSSELLGFPALLGPGGAAGDRMGVAPDAALAGALAGATDGAGVIATVSSCSGTDERARALAARTGAAAEAMEGAAVGTAAANLAWALDVPAAAFCEVRVISNTTGSRGSQRWDLRGALGRLGALGASL